MVETFGMTGMIVMLFLVLVAVYILMRMLGFPWKSEDEEDEDEESEPVAVPEKKPAGMSDEEFMDAYTGPMMEDAIEALDMAVESIKAGLHFYDNRVWEEAGGEFHSAIEKLDEASDRFEEIPGLVEDQGLTPVARAKARIDECLRLRALTGRMEEACDAMVEGKEAEAQKHAMVKKELEQAASAFNLSA